MGRVKSVMGDIVTVIWGDPHSQNPPLVASRIIDDLRISDNHCFAFFDQGPISVDGPILVPTNGCEPGNTYVQADQFIPDGLSTDMLISLGWTIEHMFPTFTQRQLIYDVLLLTTNWTGNFEGWSSQIWLKQKPVPLQRIEVGIINKPAVNLSVCVLETGYDHLGLNTVVVYVSNKQLVERVSANHLDLQHYGWRKESWVKLRRNIWSDLVMASDYWEVKVQYLLGEPIIERIEEHQPYDQQIPEHIRVNLPSDIQVAFQEFYEGY